ncbi:hypothetical protein CRG98_044806, partial [Punica granatum]
GEGLPEDSQAPEIEESLRRLEDHQTTPVEPTEEINVGTEKEPRTLKIGIALDLTQRARMIDFLKEYQEVFTWSYADMPGLDPSIVKHFLPLDTEKFLPKWQQLRRQWASLLLRIKEEVIKQINAGFLEVCNYSEWVANIVLVKKKDGRNAGATYQRAMVTLFHNMMHKEVEVYVDDMIAKSKEGEDHLVNLKRLFGRLKEYKLRLNPEKCTFGARSGKLLGFVVSERGIEVDSDKVKAIKELPPPSTVREVRSFLGRLNYIAHFIANLTDKCQSLFRLFRKNAAMEWDHECQKAFDTIKVYLIQPPILVPPVLNRPLILYLTLTKYDIDMPRTSVKGQAIADHLAEFPIDDDTPINTDFPDEEILQVDEEKEEPTWKMYFDGAVNSVGSGVGAVLISSDGRHYPVAAKMDFSCTNNVAEYEACILGLLNDTTRLTSFAGLSFQRAGAIENLEGCSSPTDPWLPHAVGGTLKAPEVVKECHTPSKPTMLKEEQTVGDHHQSPHIRQFEPNLERAISHSAFRTKFKHSGLSRSFRSILVTFGSIPVIQVHPGPYIRVHPGHSGPSWSHLGLSRSFRSTLVTFRSTLVSFSSFRSFRSFQSKFRSLRSSRSFGLIRPNFHSFGSTRSKFWSFGSVQSKFRSFRSFRSKSRSLKIHSVKIPVIRVHLV